jgi:formylmethanofuran dehydrogenase subunit E
MRWSIATACRSGKRKLKVDENGKPVLVKYEKDEELDWLTVAADKVMELAAEGNMLAVEHLANRFDGKVREQVEVTTNTNVKVRYESYEEVRAALLEEGINVDQLPLLTDMRPPEGQERN